MRTFKGRIMVDIREYYQDDSGEMRPGKKGWMFHLYNSLQITYGVLSYFLVLGISLSLEQWKNLKDSIETIDDRIDGMN